MIIKVNLQDIKTKRKKSRDSIIIDKSIIFNKISKMDLYDTMRSSVLRTTSDFFKFYYFKKEVFPFRGKKMKIELKTKIQ